MRNLAITLLLLAGITITTRTLQRITRDRTRALLFLPYETQPTNDFADPMYSGHPVHVIVLTVGVREGGRAVRVF
jgi:hypothetical protein